MTNLDVLTVRVRPPDPIVGSASATLTREVVTEHVSYPEEFWAILEVYGFGSFYSVLGGIEFLHPAWPRFALEFALCTNELQAATGGNPEFEDVIWLPVGEFGEWALYVEEGCDPVERVLFACLGADDEFLIVPGDISEFVWRFGTVERQQTLFGPEALPVRESVFFPAQSLLGLDRGWLDTEVQSNPRLAFLPGLSERLEAFPVSVPIIDA